MFTLYTMRAKPINAAIYNELIRDAQEHPDKDTQEYPHRAPIELNDEEMGGSSGSRVGHFRG